MSLTLRGLNQNWIHTNTLIYYFHVHENDWNILHIRNHLITLISAASFNLQWMSVFLLKNEKYVFAKLHSQPRQRNENAMSAFWSSFKIFVKPTINIFMCDDCIFRHLLIFKYVQCCIISYTIYHFQFTNFSQSFSAIFSKMWNDIKLDTSMMMIISETAYRFH